MNTNTFLVCFEWFDSFCVVAAAVVVVVVVFAISYFWFVACFVTISETQKE